MSKNRLADATSPYLQQHADNPVHWYPWGNEALDLARQQGKPILLSIGYSACHWCHVMAHESFEDLETAGIMNRLYVNIKVDREERPDLDKIYQTAHQLLARRPGGWPLTVFLTPEDQVPFFAGTYFPDHARHGLPAFRNLLRDIAQAFQDQREEIAGQNQALSEALARLNPQPPDNRKLSFEAAPLQLASQQLSESFDETWGGFGRAPKFPHPGSLNRLLRNWASLTINGKPEPRYLYQVDHTLTRMALGGVNDQLGGGFYRYSVDDRWMIPHFEKMLYDNGQLLGLYADLWQLTGKPQFRATAESTAAWVMREMQSPAGGYYSSLDADSEGHEGRFYIWTPESVRSLLTDEEYQHLAAYYGLNRAPNFEGQWHLHNFISIADLNSTLGSTSVQARALLDSARHKLFKVRELRARPSRDEKILTSWNALMIRGMARTGRILGCPQYIHSAERSLDFLRTRLWQDGRLLATHKDGRSQFPAYLDDHAYLLDALLELLQTRWRQEDLEFAIELAELLLTRFLDGNAGGFYFTADDHEKLIHRPKPFGDDSIPSGNGVAALALCRLGHLLGEGRYTAAAEGTLRIAWEQIVQAPYAYCTLLDALEEQLDPTETIVIRGMGADLERWRNRALSRYAPRRLVIAIANSEEDLPALLQTRRSEARTLAYVCSGTQCEVPIEQFDAFERRLSRTEISFNA
ncbi:MAG: thioredoxin domain-containing protein [Gammaproteobacteria bacterium]|nr:thioredoxin domain-containing protein [Gammaproteobacteria bacterium]